MGDLGPAAQCFSFGSGRCCNTFAFEATHLPRILERRDSGSVWYDMSLLSRRKSISRTATAQKKTVEKLWREFFLDPSQWWDHRSQKVNVKYPDFKHKETQEGLWLDNKFNPTWVETELAAMAVGTVQQSIYSWNAMLAGCVKAGQYQTTIDLFQQMCREGTDPDRFTFSLVLAACARLQALEMGRQIHSQIMSSDCELDFHVGACLTDMYIKCGSLDEAVQVFNSTARRDVVTWNVIILGLEKCGQGQKALDLFKRMQQEGMEPTPGTFVGILNACANLGALDQGMCVHELIIKRGFQSDVNVVNSLLDMYAKCGSMDRAWRVFNSMPVNDVVAWSVMILGFVKSGQGQRALELYEQMQREGIEPNHVTFVAVLNACARVGALEEGRHVHKQILQYGCDSDLVVVNSLVDMYVKCGSMENAWTLFYKMPARDVVTWNTMILGHVKYGQGQKALELSGQMQLEGIEPDSVTFMGMLNACASVAALEQGRHVHQQIIQRCLQVDVFVGNCLLDMYAKCGSIEDAWKVFKDMPMHDTVSWNTMLAGYAVHGLSKEALQHFEWMCQEGVEINALSFLSLLSACNHGGLVDEGLHYFEFMTSIYDISPTVEHYACMVGLLGRCGRLLEAEDLIKTTPSLESNASVCMTLLGACRVHGNEQMGERIANHVLQLDPENAAGYVMLSTIYATAGNWDSSEVVRKERLRRL